MLGSPDLLSEAIIEKQCFVASGASSRYAERVFDLADDEFCEAILVNLGRLDWRRRDGDTRDSKVLDGIWGKLKWKDKYVNAHLKAAAAVAYYQPKQAMAFATRLIDQGHGGDSTVCEILKFVAYNADFLEEACAQLFRASLEAAPATNNRPSDGIRILKELASFRQNKPITFIETVVDFALDALRSARALKGNLTGFDILQGALEVDVQTSQAHGVRTISITTYASPFAPMRQVRAKVISAFLEMIKVQPLRRAVVAANSLSQALRSPRNIGLGDEWSEWEREHVDNFGQGGSH